MIKKSFLPLVAASAAVLFSTSAPAGASPHATCPQNLKPIGTNGIGPAAAAALRADPAKNKPQVTGAMLAPQDPTRGGEAKSECGAQVWRRTVVVYLLDRAFLPAQSAAQRVLFVGRVGSGYRVWEHAH